MNKERQLIPDNMLSHPERGVLPPLREDNKLPIRTESLDREVCLGGFLKCLKLTMGERRYAVKIHVYTGPRLDNIIKQEKKDYEWFKRGPLCEYIPETQFVKGHGFDNKPCQIAIQPWIQGRKVGEMRMNEILKDPELLKALKQFQTIIIERYVKERHWLDYVLDKERHWLDYVYVGFELKPEEKSLENRVNSLSLLASRNLIWDGSRLWLVDTTNHWWDFENGSYKNKMTFWRLNRRRLAMAIAMLRDRYWIVKALMNYKSIGSV